VPPAPQEAARALRSREGFVFLESSQAGPQSLSLLAGEPDLVLDGESSDWPKLEHELAARSKPTAGLGHPDGAAIGWIGFDGRFRFGFYDQPHIFLH